jgi:hypothetical protein
MFRGIENPGDSAPRAVVLLFVLLIAGSASAAPACRNLPASKLRLYSAPPAATEEFNATYGEIDRIARDLDVPAAERSVHPLMLITAEVETQVAIVPQIFEVRSGGELAYCNATAFVLVGFAVVGSKVFVIDTAAAVPCVRSALLDHAAEHGRALTSEIEAYIRRSRERFQARLRELKQTPAPDRASALNAFNSGLAAFLFDMVKRFKGETEHLRESLDTPSRLQELRDSCRGMVGQMEQQVISRAVGKPARDDNRRIPLQSILSQRLGERGMNLN